MIVQGLAAGITLILMGIACVLFRKHFPNLQGQIGSAFLDPRADGGRMLAAAERRSALEPFPQAVLIAVGALMIVDGIAIVSGKIPYPLGFTAMYLAVSMAFTAVYVRPLPGSTRRVASLAPRGIFDVVPSAWFLAAIVAAVLPLAWYPVSTVRIPALFVACAGLVLVACAVRIAKMPAFILGDDVEAERHIDDRLRSSRVRLALSAAVFSSYGFCLLGGGVDLTTRLVCIAEWVLFMSFALRNLIELRRGKPARAR